MSTKINFQIGDSDEIVALRATEVPRVGDSVTLDGNMLENGTDSEEMTFDVVSVDWCYLPVPKHPYHFEGVANVQLMVE